MGGGNGGRLSTHAARKPSTTENATNVPSLTGKQTNKQKTPQTSPLRGRDWRPTNNQTRNKQTNKQIFNHRKRHKGPSPLTGKQTADKNQSTSFSGSKTFFLILLLFVTDCFLVWCDSYAVVWFRVLVLYC